MKPWLVILAAASIATSATAQGARGPIIDMHLHASRLDLTKGVPVCPGDQPMVYPGIDPAAPFDPDATSRCANPIVSPLTAEALMTQSIAELKRLSIRRAVTAGRPELVKRWRDAAPDRIIPAAGFGGARDPSLEALEALHRSGDLAVLAEVGSQYAGIPADDPRLEPYWALAERLDVPVGIHLGESMPGVWRAGGETYRAALTSPFQLEAVLARHPKLRIYVMHYASPLVDEMIAMLFTHAGLYVDVAANDWNMPRAQFHDHLKRMVDAGFEQRILFGSDQTIWPQGIAKAVEGIDSAPFLSEAQKRDIFYNNAARFLRLTPAQIAADHRDASPP